MHFEDAAVEFQEMLKSWKEALADLGKENSIRESFRPVMGNYLKTKVNKKVWDGGRKR